MISFIIVIGSYIAGLLIGLIYRIAVWCVLIPLKLIWWLIKKIDVALICALAFCIGYIWSYIRNRWQNYQAQKQFSLRY